MGAAGSSSADAAASRARNCSNRCRTMRSRSCCATPRKTKGLSPDRAAGTPRCVRGSRREWHRRRVRSRAALIFAGPGFDGFSCCPKAAAIAQRDVALIGLSGGVRASRRHKIDPVTPLPIKGQDAPRRRDRVPNDRLQSRIDDRKSRELFPHGSARTPTARWPSNTNCIPIPSSVRCMSRNVLSKGTDAPRSNSAIARRLTRERSANSCWEIFNQARAARDWAGVMRGDSSDVVIA